ncbi:MAG: alginate O-acetyltransferase AlgX-related protein [Pseudonocardiaceae bacterium]
MFSPPAGRPVQATGAAVVTVHAMSVTDRSHIEVTPRDQTHEAWLPPDHPMHRPRHGRRQLIALCCAGLFFLTPTLAHSVGIHAARFENRPLATFGDPRTGWAWLAGLPAWAADHLPFRDSAVRASEVVSRSVFDEPAALPGQRPASGSVGPALAPTPAPPIDAFPAVIEGRDGWLYLGADVSGACVPSRSLTDTLVSLRSLRAAVEASGRQFVLVVPPDKTTMVPEHLPVDYLGKDCASRARSEFWPRVVAEAGAIDLRPALADIAQRKGSPVYYPADTHWSQEGGLAMTYALADRVLPGVTRTWQGAPSGSIPWPDDIPPLLGRSGEHEIATYSLATAAGERDRTRSIASDFRVPLRLTSAPAAGTVTVPVRMIADSFTQFASRYLAAAFTDITIVHPETAAAAPETAAELLAGGNVVVLELAERNLLSGTTPILLPPFIDELTTHLARHPPP